MKVNEGTSNSPGEPRNVTADHLLARNWATHGLPVSLLAPCRFSTAHGLQNSRLLHSASTVQFPSDRGDIEIWSVSDKVLRKQKRCGIRPCGEGWANIKIHGQINLNGADGIRKRQNGSSEFMRKHEGFMICKVGTTSSVGWWRWVVGGEALALKAVYCATSSAGSLSLTWSFLCVNISSRLSSLRRFPQLTISLPPNHLLKNHKGFWTNSQT